MAVWEEGSILLLKCTISFFGRSVLGAIFERGVCCLKGRVVLKVLRGVGFVRVLERRMRCLDIWDGSRGSERMGRFF